ncbi:MAG: FHA domain-containing protein [Gammaproteobacteria bacterium]
MAKLTLSLGSKPLKSLILTGGDILIGSDPSCDIPIDDLSLRSVHARITCEGRNYRLAATADTGELQINHGHSHEHLLQDGDAVVLGAYTLVFSDEHSHAHLHTATPVPHGALRILGGKHQGRLINLDSPVTRFGSAGSLAAMISRRKDGYYLSHLEGEAFPQVNRVTIGEGAYPLNAGDRIAMGGLEFEYNLDTPQDAGQTGADNSVGTTSQRHFTRISLHAPALLSTLDEEWETRLIDLSLTGALVELPDGWVARTGMHYTLRVQLANHSYFSTEVVIRQADSERLGMAFADLDEHGKDVIRWLMEINLGDASLLKHELSDLS